MGGKSSLAAILWKKEYIYIVGIYIDMYYVLIYVEDRGKCSK